MSDAFTLSNDAVHVWSAPLCVGPDRFAALARLLSPDERARAARAGHAPTREQFVVARATLRLLLARCLGRAPESLPIIAGDNGKPMLPGREVFFNYSHTRGLAVFALTRRGEVGVDVEQLRPLPAHRDMAARYFTPAETAAIRALPNCRSEEAFFHVWTRKEAFLKATGLGLSHGLERFEVAVPPDDPPRIRHIDGDAAAGAAWSLRSLTPTPGYVAAVAIEAEGVEVRQEHDLPAAP